jgi:hypothetical protein
LCDHVHYFASSLIAASHVDGFLYAPSRDDGNLSYSFITVM